MEALHTTFDAGARLVGDLDDGFYDDEGRRDVWNEASAVGFQAYQWAVLIAAAILPWTGGRNGAWVALGLLVAWGVVGSAVQLYARERGVDVRLAVNCARPRIIAAVVIGSIGALGVLFRLLWHGGVLDDGGSTLAGAVVGGVCGAGAAVALTIAFRRRMERREAEEDRREAARWDPQDG